MIVHVTTNFSCNYGCEYCYLGSLKKDPRIINSKRLIEQLTEISKRYSIDYIDCYGGEITMLHKEYAVMILNICKSFARTTWTTNLSDPSKVAYIADRTGCKYATSLNDERPFNNQLLAKIPFLENPPDSIIQVVTPSLLKKSPKEILKEAELYNVNYVGFVQYFPSVANEFDYNIPTPNKTYCEFMKSLIEEYYSGNYKIKVENIDNLNILMEGNYTPWMDNAIFITPRNQYACIKYNPEDNGREHFHILKGLYEFDEECAKEKEYYSKKCAGCKYNGHCYAEHLRPWKENDECCGNYSLVKWYEENIYKNNKFLQSKL